MSPGDLATVYPDVIVDLRREAHDRALAELQQCLCQVALRSVVEIASDDPSMSTHICGQAAHWGYQYLGTVEEPGFSRIYLRRRR